MCYCAHILKSSKARTFFLKIFFQILNFPLEWAVGLRKTGACCLDKTSQTIKKNFVTTNFFLTITCVIFEYAQNGVSLNLASSSKRDVHVDTLMITIITKKIFHFFFVELINEMEKINK